MSEFSFVNPWIRPVYQASCKEVEERGRRYRVRLNFTLPHLAIPRPAVPHAFWDQLPTSHRLHRPTTAATAERMPDPPI